MKLCDFTFAFPALLSAIMLTATYGPGVVNAIVAIGVYNVPIFAKLTRATANGVLAREFTLAARAAGRGPLAHRVRPRAAERRAGADRAGDDPVRHRHSRRGGAVLSRARRAAAAGLLGADVERRARLDVCRAASGGLSRPRRRAQRARRSICSATACATRSIRASGRGAEMLLEVVRPRHRSALARRRAAGRARRLVFACAPAKALASSANSGSGKTMTALALMGLLPDGAVVSGAMRFRRARS